MVDSPSRDAFVDALVARSLAPYQGAAPKWLLREMEYMIRLLAEAHPHVSVLVDRARPRAAPDESETRRKDGTEPSDDEAKGAEG